VVFTRSTISGWNRFAVVRAAASGCDGNQRDAVGHHVDISTSNETDLLLATLGPQTMFVQDPRLDVALTIV